MIVSLITIRNGVQSDITKDDWFSQRMHLVKAAYIPTGRCSEAWQMVTLMVEIKNAEEIISNNYPSYSHTLQTIPSQ